MISRIRIESDASLRQTSYGLQRKPIVDAGANPKIAQTAGAPTFDIASKRRPVAHPRTDSDPKPMSKNVCVYLCLRRIEVDILLEKPELIGRDPVRPAQDFVADPFADQFG